jgi:hypothetical protein
VIVVASKIAGLLSFANTVSYYLMVIFLTLIVAYLLEILISKKIEKIRYLIRQDKK